jgi:acyl-CoA hydrolase
VDYVVEGVHPPLPQFPMEKPTREDILIAEHILPHIRDGATLQLGIGAMPNVIGTMLCQSDLKDLGMHTELCGDAYYELWKAGKLTNERKSFQRGKGVTGIVFGSKKLYDWVDMNPGVIIEPLEFVNDPETIARIDNMISINSCIAVDLYGQICAESVGLRQISGTGGQLDYVTGAAMARGGKAFICMPSTFVDRQGVRHSNIVPHFEGDIVTDPRSQAYFIVTEYGVVNLVGRTTWERAEMLVSVAHPDYRDELIAAAEKMKIWRKSNKR